VGQRELDYYFATNYPNSIRHVNRNTHTYLAIPSLRMDFNHLCVGCSGDYLGRVVGV